MAARAEQFTEPLAYHGEGPVWSDSWGGLRFVDMLAGDLLSVDGDGRASGLLHVGTVAAAFRPRTSGGMIVAIERGFVFVDPDGSIVPLGDLWSDPGVRMNEGGCDPDGRFYCGSMAYDQAVGRGSVYRFDTDGTVTTVVERVTCSNGLAWSPDHRLAYYADSPTQRVDAFDYDRVGGLTGRRPLVEIPAELGMPDGLTVDSEGCLWVAIWGGSAVHRYRPDGRLDGVVELPVTQVTAVTFGGPDLSELYVTTSRQEIPDGAQPEAGAVFRYRPGVIGLAALPFAG
jgi:sugar lactone lactonase YvrE